MHLPAPEPETKSPRVSEFKAGQHVTHRAINVYVKLMIRTRDGTVTLNAYAITYYRVIWDLDEE